MCCLKLNLRWCKSRVKPARPTLCAENMLHSIRCRFSMALSKFTFVYCNVFQHRQRRSDLRLMWASLCINFMDHLMSLLLFASIIRFNSVWFGCVINSRTKREKTSAKSKSWIDWNEWWWFAHVSHPHRQANMANISSQFSSVIIDEIVNFVHLFMSKHRISHLPGPRFD